MSSDWPFPTAALQTRLAPYPGERTSGELEVSMTETPTSPLRDDDITTGGSTSDGGTSGQDADGVDLGQDADTQDHGGGTDSDSSDADGTDSDSSDADSTDSAS